MGQQMDLLIDQSTWVPVLFRSSPVRSIRSRNYTQQRSPVSHRVTVNTEITLKFQKITHSIGRRPHFYGTSENAVKTQIWIAVCVYVLAAIIKKELALDVSLYTFLQILSVHSFEKTQLGQALFDGPPYSPLAPSSNQMNLFDN